MTDRCTADARVGQVLGSRYRVRSVLGSGGMGTVYLAEDISSGKSVAIKTLLPELNEVTEIRRRFEREAHASGFLQHPNMVEVYEMGTADDGAPYLVMELIHGRSLSELVEQGPLHPRRALVIARKVLLALGYAHQHGLVHRDLKPDNIMVTLLGDPGRQYEHVKLLDFGVVKLLADAANVFGWETLTRTGVTFGTPRYIAPEQALGRSVDARADLYALGVLLFEMLTGRPPFDNDDPMALLRMHVTSPPPPLAPDGASWATEPVRQLVGRALAKRADDRYADARAMLSALDEAFASLDHVPNPTAGG